MQGAKATLRKAIQFRRDTRPAEQRERDDAARLAIMQTSLRARMPDTVAAYLSAGSEPATLQLVAWLSAHRVRVLLPVLSHPVGGRLERPAWAPYEGPDRLRIGAYGILEPTGEPLPSEQLPEAELIICAGLAANRQGDRLGRGGGWYDRALVHASQSAPIWVLLNKDEVLDIIPVQEWDRRVDVLVTPEQMITCEPRCWCAELRGAHRTAKSVRPSGSSTTTSTRLTSARSGPTCTQSSIVDTASGSPSKTASTVPSSTLRTKPVTPIGAPRDGRCRGRTRPARARAPPPGAGSSPPHRHTPTGLVRSVRGSSARRATPARR